MTTKIDGTNGIVFPDGTTLATTPTSVGVNQSWATYSRTAGTDYQNTTGKPIQIAVTLYGGDYQNATIYIGTSTSAYVTVGYVYQIGAATYQTVSFIVPNNHWYKVVLASGETINSWAELR